ncbi:helix-turn-helix transcriptional regulator [soil metagenome]
MKRNKELIGATTSLLVLSALAREASYGYQIVKRLNDSADGLFEWQEGTIYPILHKLEAQELVRSRWQESVLGRQRKYYYITAKGRSALSADVNQWSAFSELIVRAAGARRGS